jgi:hypothetical protein
MLLKALLLTASCLFLIHYLVVDEATIRYVKRVINKPTFNCTVNYARYENSSMFLVIKTENRTQCFTWEGNMTSCKFLEYHNVEIGPSCESRCYTKKNKEMQDLFEVLKTVTYIRSETQTMIYVGIALLIVAISICLMC